MIVYAGIGARKTPQAVLKVMTSYAQQLREAGAWLRTGGAIGADQAFQLGACDQSILYLPWPSYEEKQRHPDSKPVCNIPSEAFTMASEYHPAWDRCRQGVRKMHARNMQIILGKNLDTPVNFVICWTPGGGLVGGTAMGIRCAQDHEIDVYNLADFSHLPKINIDSLVMRYQT